MTRAALVAFALVTTGCLQGSVGPYVKAARVEGGFLVVTRCVIELRGNHLSEGRCHEERKPLEVALARPTMRRDRGGPPGATVPVRGYDDVAAGAARPRDEVASPADDDRRAALIARLRPVSRELLACARQSGVHGRVVLAVVVSAQGAVAAVNADRGPAAFETCVRDAVRRADVTGLDARQYRVPLAFPVGGVR